MHAAATSVDQTDVHFWVETLKEGPNLIVNSTLGPNFEFKYTPFPPRKTPVWSVFFQLGHTIWLLLYIFMYFGGVFCFKTEQVFQE